MASVVQPPVSPSKSGHNGTALKSLDANTRHAAIDSSPIAEGNVYPTATPFHKSTGTTSKSGYGSGARGGFGAFDASPAFAPDTPPFSSPSLFARPDSALASSPPTDVPGSSPIKPATRPAASRTTSDASRFSKSASAPGKLDEHAGLYEMRASELEAEGERAKELASAVSTGKEPTPVTHFLFGSYTHSLVLGRGKPSGLPHAAAVVAGADNDDLLPGSSATTGLGARRTQPVILPNKARHVSRAHAVVEWIPIGSETADVSQPGASEGTFVVRILGQNGLIVDGRRRREGHVIRLTPGTSVIDFFGLAARFEARGAPPTTLAAATNRVVVPAKTAQSSLTQKSLAALKARHQDGSSPLKVAIEARQKERIKRTSGLDETRSSSPTVHLSSDQVDACTSSPAPNVARSTAPKPRSRQDSDEMEIDQPSSPTPASRTTQPAGVLGKRPDRSVTESESDEDERVRANKKKSGDSRVRSSTQAALVPSSQWLADEQCGGQSSDRDEAANSQDDSELSSSSAESTSPARVAAAPVSSASRTRSVRESMPPPSLMPRRNAMQSRETARPSPAPTPSADPEKTAAIRALACSCVEILKDTYDLPSLLAGAIVFHRTATISATEAVRSILTTSSSMMRGEAGDHASSSDLKRGEVVPGWGGTSIDPDLPEDRWASVARRAWREELETVLQTTDMFGVIQRKGRDAGGMPLECWYYYDHTLDKDPTRSANLGALAKPIRGALKTQKAVVWQRRAYGSSDWEGEGSQSMLPPLSASTASSSAAGPAAQLQQQAAKKLANAPPGYDAAVWLETQVEEERETSWDRIGDEDYSAGGKKRR